MRDSTRLSLMARRRNKYQRPFKALAITSEQTSTTKVDGRWVTRWIRDGRSEKNYLCPGCNRQIPVGAAHVVAWPYTPPIGASSGLDYRRHWHRACWERRP